MVHFVTPVKEDAKQLAWNLREEDLVETVLLTGKLPQGVLPAGFYDSTRCYTISTDDGSLAAMCGVVPSETPGLGQVWFLATDLIEENPVSLLRQSPKYLDILSEHYPQGLRAFLWEGNPMHLKWATAVGFEVTGTLYQHGNLFLVIQRPAP